MPRTKGSVNKKKETVENYSEEISEEEIVYSILKSRIPELFDRIPTGSISDSALKALVREIMEALK